MNPRNLRHRLPARRDEAGQSLWSPKIEEIVPRKPTAAAESFAFPNFWRALQRHKLAVLGTVAAFLVLAAIVSRLQTPMYQARILLEYRDPATSVSPFRPAAVGNDSTSEQAIRTSIAILESEPLIKRVVSELGLDRIPDYATYSDGADLPRRILGLPPLAAEPPLDRAVHTAQKQLKIRHDARVIDITYSATDPTLAANFVNTLAEDHLAQDRDVDAQAVKRLTDRLYAETSDLQRRLARSEGALRGYAEGTGLLSPTDRDNSVAEQRLRLMGEELARAQADRIARQARQELASAANPEWIPQALENTVVRDYQTKLTDLRQKSEQLKALLTPENYKVQQVENEIKVLQAARDKEFADMQKRLDNEYQASLSREKLLTERFNTQSVQVSDEASRSIHYNTLKQELETTRTMRAQVLEKAQQLSLAAASPTGGLRILGTATPPTRPYRPNYVLNLLLALFAGAFAGVVVAVTREHRRPTLRSPGEAQTLLRLPELAAIPRSREGRTNSFTDLDSAEDRLALAACGSEPSLLMESIHDALASLVSRCDQGPSVVVVTSPSPGDGKTTISANLAIALAHANRRVLLVDGDLRRARMHKIFRVAHHPGLGDSLREGAPGSAVDGVIPSPLDIPNLSLLTAGHLGNANTSMLSNARLPGIIARLRSEYDIVLIDAPPVLQGPDARILGRLADGVILVVRSRKTTHLDATAALLRLGADGVPVAGTILNDWNPRSDAAPYSYRPKESYAAASGGR